jgi:hypothetical protein
MPVIIFFRLSAIDSTMISLECLELAPVYDAESGVMRMNVNLSTLGNEYLLKNKHNIILKIMGTMLHDAAKGIHHNSEVYLCKYKHFLNRFFGFIFIGSFIPLIIAFSLQSYWHMLVFYQLISGVVVLTVCRLCWYKYEIFYEVFYTYWYDKILNFDIISANALRPHILDMINHPENNTYNSAADELAKTSKQLTLSLLQTTNEMSEKLDEFLKLQKANSGINPQNITADFAEIAEQANVLNTALTQIFEKIGASFETLSHIVKTKKTDINALNKNTALLREIKLMFENYKNDAVAAEIAHLAQTTTALQNNAANVFAAIEVSVKQNTENLSASYEAFFTLFKTFKSKLEEKPDGSIERIMLTAQEYFVQCMKELQSETVKLSDFITEMTHQTEDQGGVV